ncbi:hypothetical protein WMY93_026332 [Mugilogobius chulae]|uniref:ribonuclease H n=1 Tax=Mugilogobius chulae TaxID=88201 RepID=A0AAW0MX87_9GOBI
MATSRQDDQGEQAVRPRRIHHLPGHLDDYVLTYPVHQSNPVYPDANMNILSSNVVPAQPQYTSAQLGDGVERSPEIERIRRMEQCVSRVQDQMRELQSTLQASLNLGGASSQMPLSQQARSRSLPLLTADYNPPIQDVVMHRLDHIPPFISSSPGPDQITLQRAPPLTVQPIARPSSPQSPVPALSPLGGASAPQSVYASPSAQAAATPAVVSWPAAPITDQPHPPWQQQQRDPNWPISHPQWPTQPSVGQYSYARPMQTQPPVLLPMPGPGPPPLGQPVSQPYSTQALPPTLSTPYMYQDPADMQPPVRTHSAAPQNAPQFSSFLPAAQRPNLMEMAISSSYGIPKPKLVSFTSGKESDFLLLKKGLDGVLGPHPHLSEDYKFQVLLDHLKFPAAFQIAKRYVHDPIPYTKAMQALQQRYGQPRQLVQSEINTILRAPTVRAGDAQGFEDFALSVSSLVGLLNTLEGAAKSELECGSHVDRLLSKLPPSYQDSFAEYCLTRGILQSNSADTYTLPDFAQWLERKSQAIQISRRAAESCTVDKPRSDRKEKQFKQPKSSSSVYYGNNKPPTPAAVTSSASSDKIDPSKGKKREKFKPYCPFCSSTEHYLSSCPDFTKLTTVQIVSWINENKRCWRCGRGHQPDNCTLKKPCAICGEQHLQNLHEASSSTNRIVLTVSTASSMVYLDQATHSGRVMLKVVPVTLHCKGKSLSTHAILDDGSERTIVLSAAVHYLQLDKISESLKLRTIRQEVSELQGASVSFEISEPRCPQIKHHISNAFSATELNLAKQSCPMDTLRQKYSHLSDVPFKAFKDVQPMLLIGSDNAHLITPLSPVKAGPLGTPVALDVLPFRSEKEVTRSKQDKEALELLQNKTERVQVDGVSRYATPLLRCKNTSKLQAGPESVMALLRSTERRLTKDPDLAAVYNAEVHKLEQQGYARKLTPEEASSTNESWFIPHHIVHHNNKPRIVFNCSFHYKQDCLNDQLLPGPTLGPSLIGVLLRFREYPVAVSGDIRGMFHQVRLLTQDTPLLRFIWRDMERERSPDIYEWCVLPFGTTCSPCCATYALQRHVQDHKEGNEQILDCVLNSFYVDNCLQSLPLPSQARPLVDNVRELLATGGFEIRQWASNYPDAIAHLPTEARSPTCELWLTAHKSDPQEPTLGLAWHCSSDQISYRCRPVPPHEPTMRNIYSILASQYDPLGFIIPFTTRAKLIVQLLWQKERHWDDPIDGELLQLWQEWVSELHILPDIYMPRCYTTPETQNGTVQLHIFCDASERAYGAVAYLRFESGHDVHSVFAMARSRVAPKKQLSVPRLELCAALAGAQLCKLLISELSLPISDTVLWTDSTTVLNWIQSESCQYKVFVGTRIAELQELTETASWRYVPSALNPADDITRGKSLLELSAPGQWRDGPPFLRQTSEHWPSQPTVSNDCTDNSELKKSVLCAHITTDSTQSNPATCDTWADLVQATYLSSHGAAAAPMSAAQHIDTELQVLRQAQLDSFPAEMNALKAGKEVRSDSKLKTLSPEYDSQLGLIRVGGRLRRAENMDINSLHPIVLSPDHPTTQLIIKDYDTRLFHPGPERVFAELRRVYWILRGRQAIRKHQHHCLECKKWRANPVTPKCLISCQPTTPATASILVHWNGLFWPFHCENRQETGKTLGHHL